MWHRRECMGKWQVATPLYAHNKNNCLQKNKCSSFKAREHCSDDQTCESFNGKVNWPSKIQVSLNEIKISVNAFSKRKEILYSYWKCVFHHFNLLKYLLYFKRVTHASSFVLDFRDEFFSRNSEFSSYFPLHLYSSCMTKMFGEIW